MSEKRDVFIKGVDDEAWREARIQAIREGKRQGTWITEAIREKLERPNLEGKDKEIASNMRDTWKSQRSGAE